MKTDISRLLRVAPAVLLASVLLAGCNSSSDSKTKPPLDTSEETRPHDSREFRLDASKLPFNALEGLTTIRRWGALDSAGNLLDLSPDFNDVIDGHAYQVEVPLNWNGVLVMYAHGYRGTVLPLTVSPPSIREHLIKNGYAWAASSYSKNWYDVRAGIEDTNALALAFDRITGRGAPSKYYIIGHSMGGHIAAAAVEKETLATANNVVEYAGAVPMCGVVGDLSEYFQGYVKAVEQLAGVRPMTFPNDPDVWKNTTLPAIKDALWVDYATNKSNLTTAGEPLYGILMNLSGGERPLFNFAFGGFQDLLLSYGEDSGTSNGVMNAANVDTSKVVYRWESTPGEPLTAAEEAFNTEVFRVTPDQDANRLRSDGLRWTPLVHGDFDVPVVTLHDTADLFVPFVMEQQYLKKAREHGSDQYLVQRAIRSAAHCGFNTEEQVAAFDAMVNWELNPSDKPKGDDIETPAVLADPTYGCQFSRGPSHRAGCPTP